MSAARDVTHTFPPRPQRRPQYGSDIIVDMLQACGIVYAACNPGASFRGLHDSIVNYGGNQSCASHRYSLTRTAMRLQPRRKPTRRPWNARQTCWYRPSIP